MLHLRPMLEEELSGYLAFNTEESAKEMATMFAIPLEKARQVIEGQIAQRLPNGINSEENYLFCLEMAQDSTPVLIGYLWFSINREDSFAWVEAIDILAPFQNQGYGGEVLALAEEFLAAQEIRSISLHVAGFNQRAFRFYQRHGYQITGYNMKKNW